MEEGSDDSGGEATLKGPLRTATGSEEHTLDSNSARASELSSVRPALSARPLSFEERYALSKELARGAMGRVITGSDRAIGREVAIKEMLVSRSEHSIARFV